MTSAGGPLERFYSVIPAGGIGSRLWPLSRADAPTFLHDLTGSGKSLVRATWDRLAPPSGPDRLMVVMGRAPRAAGQAGIPGLGAHKGQLESGWAGSCAAGAREAPGRGEW